MNAERQDDRILRAAPGPELGEACVGPDELDVGLLVALREGRLGEAQVAEVDAHLLGCAHCRGMLRDLAEPLPPGLAARLQLPLRRRWRRPAWSAGAAIVAAAGLALFLLARPQPPPPLAPDYEVTAYSGMTEEMRGDEPGLRSDGTFHRGSRLRFVVAPVATLSGPAPRARAFVAGPPEGRLRALPAEWLAEAPTGARLLEADAERVFGEPAGAFIIAIALAVTRESLDALEGRTLAEAAATGGVRLLTRAARYEPAPRE